MLCFIVIGIGALALPFVQSYLGGIAVEHINKSFGTNLGVGKLHIDFFGRITLQEVTARDKHEEVFIRIDRFRTSIRDYKALKNEHVLLQRTTIEDLKLHIHKYKGEELTNLDELIAAFDNGKEGEGKFQLAVSELIISKGNFIISDDHNSEPIAINFTSLQGKVNDFLIHGPTISANIEHASFQDHWGLNVRRLAGYFKHTKETISVDKLHLITDQSELEGDLLFSYKEGDMKYFTDRVRWDLLIRKAELNTSDINVFAAAFASNKKLFVKGKIEGPMNDFKMVNAQVTDEYNTQVIGNFAFKNVFDPVAPFWMKGNISRLKSSRIHLVQLMPTLLEDFLPKVLDDLETVDLHGDIEMTKSTLAVDAHVLSSLGKGYAKGTITSLDNPDKAQYKGNVALDKFDLGKFINNKQFGKTSLDLYVDGQGFNQRSLNTSVKGDVFSFVFGKYTYKKISLDGLMKMPYYQGVVHVGDDNLQLDFNGVVDLSGQTMDYDFHADVDYADLYALKLVNDTLAKFNGSFDFKASGNSLDNLEGVFKANSSAYRNSKDDYLFDEFTITSVFNDHNERRIEISSARAMEGEIIGNYSFGEVVPLFTNALGSLYTNYSPYKIKGGQYIDFDITVHNRLIEIFLPRLTVSEKTKLVGRINNDEKEFRLNFESPSFSLDGIAVYNMLLDINNNNPLFNTYLTVDSLRTKSYKLSDINLMNLTLNDTLFIRSEFKGGLKSKDRFNLNLYHTINEDELSVLGFKKSEVFFKEFLWHINEQGNKKNKVVFNKKLSDFSIDSLALSYDKQVINFSGVVKDSTYKSLDLSFHEVELDKITPDINNIEWKGKLQGDIHFLQDKKVFKPEASIGIDSLFMNKVYLGDMRFNVDGNEQLDKFFVQSSIYDKRANSKSFSLGGAINVVDKQTYLDLESELTNFKLSPIEPLLASVLTNIRGEASGKIRLQGTLKAPDVNGRLYLANAGITSKFTGVDYNFEESTPLDITEKQFILRKAKLIDTEYQTSGLLDGSVSHKMFNDWVMDLNLSSSNLLALNTKFSEGSVYYGKAFIKGSAKLRGPIEMFTIEINATSEKGTDIKIPLQETKSTGENNYIYFLSPEDKRKRLLGEDIDPFKYRNSGIELDFMFNITPDAEIEILLDRESGHGMKGKGSGTITMEINTLGKFNMFGDFQAYEGEYNFKYGGLIDKKFVVKKYGTINWDGNPMNATLDLQAVYHTEANPSVIIDNSIINRKVPTDVAIVLNGSLSSPEINFEIEFPTVSSVVRSELEYRLTDRDTRERQAMALLATGSFYSLDNSSTALAGSLFERASSIFDELFSDEDDKFKVGLNYAQGERNPFTQTEGRLGVTFSTQVNDRISVNGKLGVPVGGEEQSVIVGDVEVLLRLNHDGTMNARFFNRENDINYIGEGIGYTQGVGITYEVDFDTFRELLRKIIRSEKNKEVKKEQNSETDRSNEIPDSNPMLEFIRSNEHRRRDSGKQ